VVNLTFLVEYAYMKGEELTCSGCGYPVHINEHAPDCASNKNQERQGLVEGSELYQRLYKQNTRQNETLFGSVLPGYLDRWNRVIEDETASAEQRDRAQQERTAFLSGEHPRMSWTIERLSESVGNVELQNFLTSLAELEQTDLINVADSGRLSEQFAKMDGQQVLNFLEWYGRAFEKRKEVVLETAELKRSQFIQRAEAAIQDGWLRGRVDFETVKRRVEEIVFDVSDPLMNDAEGSADVWRIVINAKMDEEGVDDVVTHELSHAALSVRELNGAQVRGFDRLQFPRSGLRLKEYDQDGQDGNVQYEAINEAMTEIASLRLRGKDPFGKGGYAIERGSLQVLLDRNPEYEEMLWNAWTTGEDGSNIEAWKAFQEAEDWSKVIQSPLNW
jgi:hypothetical protein